MLLTQDTPAMTFSWKPGRDGEFLLREEDLMSLSSEYTIVCVPKTAVDIIKEARRSVPNRSQMISENATKLAKEHPERLTVLPPKKKRNLVWK